MIDSIGAHLNPIVGICAIPCTGVGYGHTFLMRPREILAANLRALMAYRPGLDTLVKITNATGGSLSNGNAANGNSWSGSTMNLGNMQIHQGTNSQGQSYNRTCIAGICN